MIRVTELLIYLGIYIFFSLPQGAAAPSGPGPPPYRCFTITLRFPSD